MKLTLDLTRLLHDVAITQTEHDRLASLGRVDTALLLVNVLGCVRRHRGGAGCWRPPR